MDEEFWKNVLFCDESKFNIFGSDGRSYVLQTPNTELHNLRPTVKHGGNSVMVWGAMSVAGVGNLHFIDYGSTYIFRSFTRQFWEYLDKQFRELTRH